jgi:hypothetical protein
VAFVARFLGRRIKYTYELVELDPGQRLVMRTQQGPFPTETVYTWQAIDDRSHAGRVARSCGERPAGPTATFSRPTGLLCARDGGCYRACLSPGWPDRRDATFQEWKKDESPSVGITAIQSMPRIIPTGCDSTMMQAILSGRRRRSRSSLRPPSERPAAGPRPAMTGSPDEHRRPPDPFAEGT